MYHYAEREADQLVLPDVQRASYGAAHASSYRWNQELIWTKLHEAVNYQHPEVGSAAAAASSYRGSQELITNYPEITSEEAYQQKRK